MKKQIFVVNSQKEREPFSFKKVYLSALRAGAESELAKKIAGEIEKEAYDGITTYEIFHKVQKMLYKDFPREGMRFSLKEAMRKLGPSGFPFEKYVSAIFRILGFETETNKRILGKCVFHEIDFLAQKGKEIFVSECKFHQLRGSKVDLKIALSHYARFLDLKSGSFFGKNLKIRPMIVTNTKFTSEVIKYAECVKINLLGWRYPLNRGLEYVIESEKFYPITILPSLKGELVELFSRQKIMLAQDLLKIDPSVFSKKFGLEEKTITNLKNEAEILFGK
ncbi:MAG: hypothetical protein WC042_01455 [Candidatus Paceibacterota bacterium]|jgi:hypothetical protein|nr:hypothetical protein [Candidatus Paceibacterota bacterium]